MTLALPPEVEALKPLIDNLDSFLKDRQRKSDQQMARDLCWTASRRTLSESQLYWVKRLLRTAQGNPPKPSPHKGKKMVDPSKIGSTQIIKQDVDLDELVSQVLAKMPAAKAATVDTEALVAAVLAKVDTKLPRRIEVALPGKPAVDLGTLVHCQFAELLQIATLRIPVCLVGPAGSGKTTVSEQLARSLGLTFYFSGQMTGAHELTGFVNMGGYVTTPFRQAFEHGGVFLCDEVDGSDPSVPNTLNAALANGEMSFPDQALPVKRHPDFICIAAGNTYGRGADRVYVGRNQLDGAFLDRFVFVEFGYDEALERKLACNDAWVKRVQKLRAAAEAEKARIIISPRASIYGAKLLAAGMNQARVEDIAVWKGIAPDLRRRITDRAY